MNYIGSKQRLSTWIQEIINQVYKDNINEAIFADIFAGTGQIARKFKSSVKQVIVNDLENYSFILNSHYIGNTKEILKPYIDQSPFPGIIYNNFTDHCVIPRKYFTVENAQIIDGIRNFIEYSHMNSNISKEQYYWALASLIECSDSVANTTSVYGSFLKEFKKSALKKINFNLVEYEKTDQENKIYQMDANALVKNIKGDILYLDPPYNNRQYGANYHVLNKIVENKDFSSAKLTGLTEYNKSDYCKVNIVNDVFEDLIKNADFSTIFISYNNEGLIPENKFKNILKQYGDYELHLKEYKRYKADSKRLNQPATTFEHLHVLRKK